MSNVAPEIISAIMRANKLGAKGEKVVAVWNPPLTTSSRDYILVTEQQGVCPASQTVWYER